MSLQVHAEGGAPTADAEDAALQHSPAAVQGGARASLGQLSRAPSSAKVSPASA